MTESEAVRRDRDRLYDALVYVLHREHEKCPNCGEVDQAVRVQRRRGPRWRCLACDHRYNKPEKLDAEQAVADAIADAEAARDAADRAVYQAVLRRKGMVDH